MRISNWEWTQFLVLVGCIFQCTEARLNFFQKATIIEVNDLNPKKLSPVIFVPGDGGSQVEAKLNKPSTVHYYCEKTADYFNIWLNPKLLVPLIIECWIDNVKLIYNTTTRKTENMPGVELRIPGFGRSDVVEWLDPSITKSLAGAYFKDIANALVAKGYIRDVTLRGAPYDFRKAPNENQQWFTDMKKLVEETFELGGQQRITLLVHSMGGPMTLVFLQNQTPAWKDKYIEQVISLAGAYAGSVKAVKVFAIGDDLGSFALSGSTMRAEQITSPSLAWLMPSPHFWKPDEVLVSTAEKQYTMSNLSEFFAGINYTNGWEMRKDTLPYTDFTAPGVQVHCLYGEGYQTVERLNYKGDFSTTPTLVTGDGDGTVNSRSLKSCEQWANTKAQREKPIHSVELPGAEHMGILSDKRTVQYVLKLLTDSEHYDIKEIPGVGGNQLQATLNKPSTEHFWCSSTSDLYDIWLNPTEMVPGPIDCWVDNMKLSYDNSTRTTRNSPGVNISVPGWGKVFTMDTIDKSIVNQYDYGIYFANIITALSGHGYDSNQNMYGAPYDFRKGPNELKNWFLKLKDLVEKAFTDNSEERVTFITHSMGGRMLLYFLQNMSTEWKDKYIEQMITMSTPWGGAVQAIQAITVGYDFGSSFLQNAKMRTVQESCPSVVWLLPTQYFWKPDEVLINTKNKNYSISDIEQFFYDINNPYIVEMKKDLADYQNFSAPGITIHCLYGHNMGDTVDRLDFGAGYNPNPTFIRGNGDGTVNERSLIGCGHWANTAGQNGHRIYQQAFPNVEHYDLLADYRVINYILNRLTGAENYLPKPNNSNLINSVMKYRIF